MPPRAGEPGTKTVRDKTFSWCAKCKRWKTTHDTATHIHHKRKQSDNCGHHRKAKQTDNCCHRQGSHTTPAQHPSLSNQTHDSGACALRDIKEKENVRAKVVMEDAALSSAAATASEGSDPLEPTASVQDHFYAVESDEVSHLSWKRVPPMLKNQQPQ